jgi:Asp-tRNA(Asn)/Glu-tRNA(Gln) amidotransferase A subunit family amidase
MTPAVKASPLDASRRHFLAVTTSLGLGHTLLPGALLALATSSASAQASAATRSGTAAAGEHEVKLAPITPEMIEQAALLAGLTFTEAQRKVMIENLTSQRDDIVEVRKLSIPNAVAPALVFNPVPPGAKLDTIRKPAKYSAAPHVVFEKSTGSEAGLESLAFSSVRELAELLRTKRVTSTALTKMYLTRLKRLDAQLHCVITLTEDRALKQAAAADREIAAGKYRGPLHGIPWGGKDLLAVAGYPTTWGAAGFEAQTFDYDAEVVKRLDAAGAVLIAKLSMGALAQGDLWGYPAGSGKPGARTRNPWNLKQGSSGSSAGSASAVAAGCVGFGIGTETLGSISSPSTRCGTTGLRPSFGLVPRTGAMALTWSMDKIGPIARSVEDAAIVLATIYGPDGHDLSVQSAAFNPDFTLGIHQLRVGYLKSAFDAPTLTELKPPSETLAGKELEAFNTRVTNRKAAFTRTLYDAQFNTRALETLRAMGINLIAKDMPKFPFGALVPMLEAEAAAAFDELTRNGRDALLSGQQPFDWPNQFRTARFYPAVDYIQAARARTQAIAEMTALFADVDVIVTPSGGPQLTATNLTGQPAVIVPNGFRGPDAPPPPSTEDGALNNAGGPGTPVSITFLAPLYGEAKACALAHAYQQKTGFHLQHPKLA